MQCHVLSEAALMMGLRLLLPATLSSFHVLTGLERGKEQNGSEEVASGGVEHAATVGKATAGHAGASRGTVELELERHLLELRFRKNGVDPGAILALKKGSPAQFSELKQRLADSITVAQRVGEQLRRCAQFFDSHE